ncbi:MAG: cyclic nucleotide-binding domain-containing protein [Alphaproteobacteria bacterium]
MSIRRIDITPGVQWVEVEDVGLRVLCGSPADVVKHLMRRGLIVPSDVTGAQTETGPNTILLSDIMLQGGAFANLAEFPVLQMLYRQGMILPGHPNNTGQKPLLLGLQKQIEAQLNYIHRGNYGLVSKEELIDSGLSDEAADEMMRIKLHFAFGNIRSAGELLDTLSVGIERMEIRDGVFIRRLGLNRYRFDYQDIYVDVDMNLSRGETYESPYPLGMHKIERNYFSVIHTGEGDGWDIDRPCMSSVLSFQGRLFLIDAGPNLEAILQALSLSVNEIDGIFHTHCHDDHFAGLTTLMQSDHKLNYYAAPMVRAAVTKKFAALLAIDEQEFGTYFNVIDLVQDKWNDLDGLDVKPVMSPHPMETTIFQFRALGEDGYRYYSHLADIASDDVMDAMVANPSRDAGISESLRKRTRESYGAFAHLKKIDIGGGLIHGSAGDFSDDPSDKLVLAHVARRLSKEERHIGSGAEFGTADVLIQSTQDYMRRIAYDFFKGYFPDQPPGRLHILLNSELRTFNPHEILMHEGEKVNDLLLIISGNAEALSSLTAEPVRLSTGTLLGEIPILQDKVASDTYRATCYLQALVIPGAQYAEFVSRYCHQHLIEEFVRKRAWLRTTWVFGDRLGSTVHNRIAAAMTLQVIGDGLVKETDANRKMLRIIEDGVLKRFVGDTVSETLRAGDSFNEERCLFGLQSGYRLQSVGPTRLWEIPASVIFDIPVVRHKLLEDVRRRLQLVQDSVVLNTSERTEPSSPAESERAPRSVTAGRS